VVLGELGVEHHNLLVVRKFVVVVSMGLVVVERMNRIQFRWFGEVMEQMCFRMMSILSRVLEALGVELMELRIQLVFQRILELLELELGVALELVDRMIRMILS